MQNAEVRRLVFICPSANTNTEKYKMKYRMDSSILARALLQHIIGGEKPFLLLLKNEPPSERSIWADWRENRSWFYAAQDLSRCSDAPNCAKCTHLQFFALNCNVWCGRSAFCILQWTSHWFWILSCYASIVVSIESQMQCWELQLYFICVHVFLYFWVVWVC